MAYLTDDPIDARALVERVMRPSDGAYVLFEGVVRDHHEGKSVESIFYDAYRPMAENEIDLIVRDVQSQFPDIALAEGTTARDVWQSLRGEFAKLADYTQPPMIAVNESYAAPETILRDGDELAFIPPVAGG